MEQNRQVLHTPQLTPRENSQAIMVAERQYQLPVRQVDFPIFEGRKLNEWIHKCERFFLFDKTPKERKVEVA